MTSVLGNLIPSSDLRGYARVRMHTPACTHTCTHAHTRTHTGGTHMQTQKNQRENIYNKSLKTEKHLMYQQLFTQGQWGLATLSPTTIECVWALFLSPTAISCSENCYTDTFPASRYYILFALPSGCSLNCGGVDTGVLFRVHAQQSLYFSPLTS